MNKCLQCEHIKAIGEIGLCIVHRIRLSKKRAYYKRRMQKYRAKYPKKCAELNRKHQHTWRTKHPDLNRLRARLGFLKAKRLKGEV